MNKLQNALTINAVFSIVSGLILIILNHPIAKLFGTDNNTVFWIVGIALVFFACTIILEIIKQRKLPIIWIIIQDFFWVIGSIYLLLINPFSISNSGNIVIGLVAIIVLFMGINQTYHLSKIDYNPNDKGKR